LEDRRLKLLGPVHPFAWRTVGSARTWCMVNIASPGRQYLLPRAPALIKISRRCILGARGPSCQRAWACPPPCNAAEAARAADERPGAKPPKHWRSMSRTAPLHHARASRWLPLPCPDCPDCLFANRHTSCCLSALSVWPLALRPCLGCVVFAPAIAHRLRACHPLGCTAAVTRV